MLDRDERHDDEQDEKGSDSFASRTTFGAAWALSEKFPELLATKHYFGGLFSVRMYAYYWLYTIAELQLLAIDQPIVVYHHENKDKDGKRVFKKLDALTVLKAQKKYEESKAKRGDKPIVLDFSNFGGKSE